ncbi:MAG TPA: DUF4838 domain-containing protein [Planctomycetota bacterium]|nr:DUF4838 domain-containing protein [Planctomycetota bacterium]
MKRVLPMLVALAILRGWAAEPAGAAVTLAADGKAQLPIVTAKAATARVQKSAATLASYLQKISGAAFELVTGDGASGIAVGTISDFPELQLAQPWDPANPAQREDYLIHTHARGILLIGASELAVEHAVWDMLYRLGYRQFFPGPTWEVIPESRTLTINFQVREHPAYNARRIWYANGMGDWSKPLYADWCARNRAVSGIEVNSGHAYDGIIKRNQAEFDKHPEYLGLVDGKRTSSKFCISNPGLRELVKQDALRQIEKNPALQSVSIDPSDGGGWCECENCRKLGSISDHAVMLANELAETLTAKYPDKFVGMYAYNHHSPPPTIRVHPRVVINVATAFIKGDYTVEALLEGWQKQGATTGIREYYSVHAWDRDLPGRARGANPEYLRKTIPHFHERGARFMSAESSDNWGCNGLGYYLAARMLWDVREGARVEQLKVDFFEKAFGPAKETMSRFYALIDASSKPLLSDDLIGRMYRLLAEARSQSTVPAIRRRCEDLILYTRYVELWSDYTLSENSKRQDAFEALARFAYRIRTTGMVHTSGLIRDLPKRDKTIRVPKEAERNVPPGKNIWMSSEPFTAEEIDKLLAAGIERRKPFDFQPVSFEDNLVPATPLNLPSVATGSFGGLSRGSRVYHTWLSAAPGTVRLTATAGLVYDSRGAAKLGLFPQAEAEGNSVADADVEPDKQPHEVQLSSTYPGHHRVEISDRMAGTEVSWTEGTPMCVQSSPDVPATFWRPWTLYFYVPRGTQIIGGFASGKGTLRDPSGKAAFVFKKEPQYFSVPVPPGSDGGLWKFENCEGQRLLMTVPPYLARNEKELLLPASVVARDRK